MALVDLIHPDDLVEALSLFDRPEGDAEPSGIQSRYRCKDGSWRWLEWTARIAPETGLVYGAARDVTAHHVAQAALGANEARLQAILDHSNAAIFVKDRMGRYVLVNEVFLRASGLDRERSAGQDGERDLARLHPSTTATGVSSTTVRRSHATTSCHLDDGPHVMMTARFPLLDASGAVTGMAAISTDITDWTKVQAALA